VTSEDMNGGFFETGSGKNVSGNTFIYLTILLLVQN